MMPASPIVKMEYLPNGGDPFAVVIDSYAQAEISAAVDGTSVTIVLRKPGQMPCSVIFPGDVAAQVFGPDYVAVISATASEDTNPGEPHTFTGGGA